MAGERPKKAVREMLTPGGVGKSPERKKQSGKPAEGQLQADAKTAKSPKVLAVESSYTDSTMYSAEEQKNWRNKKPKHVINLDELMKEDITPPQTPKSSSQMNTALQQSDRDLQSVDAQMTLKTQHKPATNQEQFDKKHGYRRTNLSLMRKLVYQLKVIKTWRRMEWIHFLKSRFPIIAWLPAYDWREDLIRDIVNGIMISIIYIPQGLAYGLMVGLPPIYGIYTGIVGPLIYVFLGTSRQVSTGAFAIVALMVGSVIEQSTSDMQPELNQTRQFCCAESVRKPDPEKAIQLSSLITFIVGVIQVVFGLLNAGLLAVWLSDQLVEGLTSGAAVHVLVSQLQTMTGVKNVPRTSDVFGIVRFMICFFRNIGTFQNSTLMCTAIVIFCLLISKSVIDPIIKPWMIIKFPMELFVVVFSIVLCYFAANTSMDWHLDIVGDIEIGMRAPFVPDFGETGRIIFSAFSIAIVSFVIHIALAKLIAKQYKYQINVNQEWLALGAMHIVASLFGCFAGGSSLSRSVTSAKLGTKSQLFSDSDVWTSPVRTAVRCLYFRGSEGGSTGISTLLSRCHRHTARDVELTTLVVVIVLLIIAFGAAPLFKYLPKTVLSCIVVVAMNDLYLKVCWSRALFLQSTVDFCIFLVTFTSVVLISVNIGLAIGIVFALLTVVLRSQWPESTCMGRIPGTSDFKGIGHYRTAMEIPGIKVFRFDAPLYFANAELFLSSIHSATGLDPLVIVAHLKETADKKKKQTENSSERGKRATNPDEEIQLTVWRRCVHPSRRSLEQKEEAEDLVQLTHIIVDCSSFPYIDLMGVDALTHAYTEYQAINISVFFACCKVAVRQMFENSHFYEHVPKSYMFVSLQDAVAQAQYEQEQGIRFGPSMESIPNRFMSDETPRLDETKSTAIPPNHNQKPPTKKD